LAAERGAEVLGGELADEVAGFAVRVVGEDEQAILDQGSAAAHMTPSSEIVRVEKRLFGLIAMRIRRRFFNSFM
jgi:hypothetical protein